MRVLNCAFDRSLESEENAVIPLAGGIMQHGYQCGMIWGATLAAGAQAYRLLGPGSQAETKSIIAAQRLVESFRALAKNIDCFEIVGEDKSSSVMQMIINFLIKGRSIGCFRLATRYAPVAFAEINTVFSEGHDEVHSHPVSCSTMLAQKMGVSDMQTVMTAGFAGGIGLSGGACGALGAIIWIIGMNGLKEGDGKIRFNNPRAIDAVDRLLKYTDFEFECSEIIGRRFENIDDHAAYLRDGGCSRIIEVLANE